MTTPSHTEELFQVSNYLGEHARSDFKKMPEGSVAKVLNGISPEARKSFATQYLALDHARDAKRNMPFEEKLTDEDIMGGLPETLRKTVDRIDTEQVTNRIHERMGTQQAQAELNNQPPTLRETISAAAGDSNE